MYFRPFKPEAFTCEEAAALLLSTDGQFEAFSEKDLCHQKLTNAQCQKALDLINLPSSQGQPNRSSHLGIQNKIFL